jgi:hypothetical protein
VVWECIAQVINRKVGPGNQPFMIMAPKSHTIAGIAGISLDDLDCDNKK